MALVIPNAGKTLALQYILGRTSTTENLVLKLYRNDVTPSVTSVNADFVYLDSGSGYTPLTLTATQWTIDSGSASYPQHTWTFTGPVGNVYGYAVVTETSNTVLMAERFLASPYNVQSNDDTIRVTLNITLS
jgi:hypothetical protein